MSGTGLNGFTNMENHLRVQNQFGVQNLRLVKKVKVQNGNFRQLTYLSNVIICQLSKGLSGT